MFEGLVRRVAYLTTFSWGNRANFDWSVVSTDASYAKVVRGENQVAYAFGLAIESRMFPLTALPNAQYLRSTMYIR